MLKGWAIARPFFNISQMDCLKNVIGITREPCECLEDDLPEDYSLSDSGLYMDELPEAPLSLKSINSITDCGRDLGKILTNSRQQAIAEFKRDLYKHLQVRMVKKIKPFSGNVGGMVYGINVNLNSTYAGLMLQSKNIRGASLMLNKIHVAFNASKTFDLYLYKVISGVPQLIQTFNLESQSSAWKDNVLVTPVELPLSEDGLPVDYYFVYELDGQLPKDNSPSCNCGLKESDMQQYFVPKGIFGDDIHSLSNTTKYANGLVLSLEASCGNEGLICDSYTNNEFIQTAVQWSILRKAVEILIFAILNSDEVNRYTMAKREQMTHNAYRLSKKFNNDVQWISENINLKDSDCFTCNDANDYRLGSIRL